MVVRHLPSSHMIAIAARTIRSLSCSPSVPTAIREFAIEVGNSVALIVIIFDWLGCGKGKHNSATEQENRFQALCLMTHIKIFKKLQSVCARVCVCMNDTTMALVIDLDLIFKGISLGKRKKKKNSVVTFFPLPLLPPPRRL